MACLCLVRASIPFRPAIVPLAVASPYLNIQGELDTDSASLSYIAAIVSASNDASEVRLSPLSLCCAHN